MNKGRVESWKSVELPLLTLIFGPYILRMVDKVKEAVPGWTGLVWFLLQKWAGLTHLTLDLAQVLIATPLMLIVAMPLLRLYLRDLSSSNPEIDKCATHRKRVNVYVKI